MLLLLLLYCLQILFKIIQGSGSCCCGWLYCLPLLFMVLQRSGSCCCYIVYHYCVKLYRGVVHVLVVILSTIAVYGLTEEWFKFWLVILSTIAV
jgi:hypothetical protein